MTLLLWDRPFSPDAQEAKIALREKALAFETRVADGIACGSIRFTPALH